MYIHKKQQWAHNSHISRAFIDTDMWRPKKKQGKDRVVYIGTVHFIDNASHKKHLRAKYLKTHLKKGNMKDMQTQTRQIKGCLLKLLKESIVWEYDDEKFDCRNALKDHS